MHMYVVARGHIDKLSRWENDLSSKYFPYLVDAGRKSSDGKGWLVPPTWSMVQLAVRPIQLYELVFPEPCLNDVLKVVQPYGGYGISPKFKKFFRNVLKMGKIDLKDIPKVEPDKGFLNADGSYTPPKNYMFDTFVDVLGIGLKEDKAVKTPPVEDL